MKSVGIITYHFLNNYGTMLQALALQNKIESYGVKSELIDYRIQDYKESKFDILKIRIKRIAIYIRGFSKYYIKFSDSKNEEVRKERFREFYNKNIITGNKRYNTYKELQDNCPEYDIYIVGSDQTWNPNVSKAPEAFYLTFVSEKEGKTLGSYAPSIGVSSLSQDQKNIMKSRLEKIEYLSCREEKGANIIKELTGRDVTTVLDPTFLLNRSEWNHYCADMKIGKQYILQYFLGDVKECREFVEKLSEKTGLDIIVLPHSYLDIKDSTKEKMYVGPGEFLALVKNATYVCTDSFHGTAFSINFNKNFYSFHKRKNTEATSDNSRISDILSRLNLEDRLITDNKILDVIDINYEEVNKKLTEFRESSEKFLEKIIG